MVLTVAKQPQHSGHIGVVFIIALDEDVLAGVDEGGPGETLHPDGQRAGSGTTTTTSTTTLSCHNGQALVLYTANMQEHHVF